MSNNNVDITITAALEYGQIGTLRIYGVEILNIGSGISVDDIVTEQQCTFICREIGKWTPIDNTRLEGSVNVWDRVNSTLSSQAGSLAAAQNVGVGNTITSMMSQMGQTSTQ